VMSLRENYAVPAGLASFFLPTQDDAALRPGLS